MPTALSVRAGAARLWVLHDIAELDADPAAAGFAAVIYGHSHRPQIAMRGAVVLLNPGSAGPRRFSLPISLGLLTIDGDALQPQLLNLL